MTSTIDFRSPGAGFDQPQALWLACHERVRRFAALLTRLGEHLDRSGTDADAQTTATSIRRYFNEAAPRHHEDEEIDLLPRLRERLDPDADASVLAAIDRIAAEHGEMAQLWSDLDRALAAIEQGRIEPLPRATVARFASLYDRHIDLEEGVLLPAMQRAFAAADWRQIGRAMAQRRGVDWSEIAPGDADAGGVSR